MPFVLFLLGAAAVGLVAASASAKGKQGGDGRGEGRTYTLDSSLPAQLRQQLLAALATEKDPTRLVTFAAQCADAGYPFAAAALTQRAVELGGAPSLPAPQSQPAPPARARPQPGPASPGTPVPGPAQPAAPTSALDASMPTAMQVAVLGALTTEHDAGKLQAFAQEIQLQYPIAAGLLMAKANAMRLTQQPQPAAAPMPVPTSPAQPPQAAPANPFTLDATLPPAMQSAVLGALTTEQDANKLQAFAQEIQAQYPIAAGLLMAKANAMRIPQQPAPQPIPTVHVAPVPTPAPTPAATLQATPAGLPVGDASTRTGRNAARPTGYPFIHLRGESTYPAKIAKQATGSEANYSQLTHINPQFAKDGVHWINIQTGDALNIPWEWVPKLTGLYHLEVDPGVSPPASAAAAAPSAALAVRKGGTNGLTTHA